MPRRIELQGEQGQAMVEFALVLPIILLLLFGMLQFALVLNARQTVAYAAQAAANGYAQTLIRAQADARAANAGTQIAPRFATAGTVGYSLIRGANESAITADGTGTFGDLVVARATYRYPSPIRAGIGTFRFPDTIDLSAEAVARIEAPGTASSGSGPSPTPPPATPSAGPTPTPSPTPSPTPRPTATPTPTPMRVPIRVAVCVDGFDGGDVYGPSWRGRFLGGVNVLTAPGYSGSAAVSLSGASVSLQRVGPWNNPTYLTQYRGWAWSFGWWYSAGTYTPTVTLAGYPPAALPSLTIVKTTRFDYRCSVGWVQ